MLRAGVERLVAEAAHIAVGIEHLGAFGEAGDEGAVVALVEEPAGLLPRRADRRRIWRRSRSPRPDRPARL